MLRQYFAVKEQFPDHILFYRLGDFYEMFFDDAEVVAAALNLTLTKRGQHQGKDVPMCGIPYHAYDSYLARLIRKGFKVAVCEQSAPAAGDSAKKKPSGGLMERHITRLITPGTLTEDVLLAPKVGNYIMAAAPGGRAVAVAEVSAGVFITEPTDNLAAAIAKHAPAEILLPEGLDAPAACRPTVLPMAKFAPEAAAAALRRYYGVATLDGMGELSEAEIQAAGALADYICLTHQGTPPRLPFPVRVASGSCLEIDAAARRNLELFQTLSADSSSPALIDIIDRTATAAGGRELRLWLASPLADAAAIGERQAAVARLASDAPLRREVRELLAATRDMKRCLARLSSARGGPRDLAAVRDTLQILPSLRLAVGHLDVPYLAALSADMGYFDDISGTLSAALAPDLPLLTRDGGFIARGYSAGLDELLDMSAGAKREIAGLQAEYAADLGVPSLKIAYNSLIGFFIEVPAKSADKPLARRETYIHRQTMVSGVRFTTAELGELEDKVSHAKTRATAVELELFARLAAQVEGRIEELEAAATATARLDVVAGLAELAAEQGYCRPTVSADAGFDIVKGRHPVVGGILKNGFVPNDCRLETGCRLWLLTGPNMGGKSTFLRQNALIVIMAQMGSFVPAQSARIGVVDRLFSRVGAGDDLARGQSTFMVEMAETAAILNRATPRSFVILDEIGRGTATFDGLAIAWAVVEQLHRAGCRTLFATHYHELTVLARSLPHLALRHVAAQPWNGGVVFLHEVREGAADRSYGLHVARLAGLPEPVLKRAEKILENLEKTRPTANSGAVNLQLALPMLETNG
ncbi:DNA mismatch repair protein MutS [Alphaproteobacteria bacterium]|nr:DNA mismatch repair protein MutS [Alphaproteobacteria bacterium]